MHRKSDKKLSVNFVVPVFFSEEIQGWILLFIFTLGHTKSLGRENLPRITDCADCVTIFLPICPRRNMTFFSFPVVFAWRGKRPLRVCGLSSDKTIRTCLHEDDPGMFKDAFVWSDDEVTASFFCRASTTTKRHRSGVDWETLRLK